MWLLKTILFVILVIFFVALIAGNTSTSVVVRFFTWESQPIYLWLVILGSILAGFVAGLFVTMVREFRLRLDQGKLKRERDELAREVGQLRAAPLDDLVGEETRKVQPPL